MSTIETLIVTILQLSRIVLHVTSHDQKPQKQLLPTSSITNILLPHTLPSIHASSPASRSSFFFFHTHNMVNIKSARAIALSTLISTSYAHLIMLQPVPYSKDTLDNSPLINAAPGASNSNFPCKLRANAFEVTQENNIKVGEQNEISWSGSASHGGGTCQLSVTLDREPSANSTFKVIASWIGGCPTSSDGNGGTHPFQWTMPPEVPNGKATFAWNWVSKLSGQPENYMNCAPITVTGGADNTDEFDKLEDLFRVNLPSSDCGSQASHDLEIPNPGKYVTTFGSTALATPTGTGCAAMGQASATEGASSAATTGASDAESSAASAAAPTAAAFSSGLSVYSASSSSEVSLVFPTVSSSLVSSAPTAASSSAGSASGSDYSSGSASISNSTEASSGATGSSSSTNGTGSCTTNGAIVCNGESQFGLCNFGSVVWQDVAAGTTCQNGQISKRALHHARHIRHPHGRWA